MRSLESGVPRQKWTQVLEPEGNVPPSHVARHTARTLTAAWRRNLLPEPLLDPDQLTARAFEAERWDDFGPTHWQGGFAALVASLQTEARLNPIGRTLAHGQLVQILRERLRAYRLWRKHPEILDRPLSPPIIILGSMRSGTTRVQRLLACDRRLTYTRLFESVSPVVSGALVDHRPWKAWTALRLIQQFNPALRSIHPAAPLLPDEEFGLLGFSFASAHFEVQWQVPTFARWCEERGDKAAAYREFRMLLQSIAWSRGDRASRPWILKVPQFMEDLDALLATFPGARLICLHREADAVVGSSASLVWEQTRIQSNRVSKTDIGQTWLRKSARRTQLAAEARMRHAHVPQIDVSYADIDHDWETQVRRIYDFLDTPLTPGTLARMRRFLGSSRAHRGHSYRLSDFGLTSDEIRARMPHGA